MLLFFVCVCAVYREVCLCNVHGKYCTAVVKVEMDKAAPVPLLRDFFGVNLSLVGGRELSSHLLGWGEPGETIPSNAPQVTAG